MVLGLGGICVGVYGSLDGTTPRYLAGPMLVIGSVTGALSLGLAGAGVSRTSYRPDRWRTAELLTIGCGLGAAVLIEMTARIDPASLNPAIEPSTWPTLSVTSLAAVAVAALPAYLAPPPGVVDSDLGVTRRRAVAAR
jgi:energy-coupling factor transport system permease protein